MVPHTSGSLHGTSTSAAPALALVSLHLRSSLSIHVFASRHTPHRQTVSLGNMAPPIILSAGAYLGASALLLLRGAGETSGECTAPEPWPEEGPPPSLQLGLATRLLDGSSTSFAGIPLTPQTMTLRLRPRFRAPRRHRHTHSPLATHRLASSSLAASFRNGSRSRVGSPQAFCAFPYARLPSPQPVW